MRDGSFVVRDLKSVNVGLERDRLRVARVSSNQKVEEQAGGQDADQRHVIRIREWSVSSRSRALAPSAAHTIRVEDAGLLHGAGVTTSATQSG